MGILSRHIGSSEPIDIDGDKIYLYPLSIDDLPLFFKALKAFSGAKKDGNAEDMLKNMTDDSLSAIKQIIEKVLLKSLPNEPEEDRKVFGMKYMMTLFPAIMNMNLNSDSHEVKKKEALLEALQKKE